MKNKNPYRTAKRTQTRLLAKISIFFIGFVPHTTSAEYLFLTQTKHGSVPTSQKEHAIAHTIYTTYTFPMNTAHDNTLSLKHVNGISCNEHEHDLLQTVLPSPIVALYIPNTLYELLVVHAYTYSSKIRQKMKVIKKYVYDRLLDKSESYTQHLTTKYQLRDLHYHINTYALQQLPTPKSHAGYTLNQTRHAASQLISTLYTTYQNAPTATLARLFANAEKPLIQTLLQTSIAYEHKAQAENCHVIYRGTNECHTFVQTKNTTTPHSCSYGLSLFSGFHYDSGACAFMCMARSNYKKAIFINKAAYQARSDDYAFFYIPPFNSLAGFFSCGEMFHARSKIHPKHLPACPPQQRVNTEVAGICEHAITYATLYKHLVTDRDQFPTASIYESALASFLNAHECTYDSHQPGLSALTNQYHDQPPTIHAMTTQDSRNVHVQK